MDEEGDIYDGVRAQFPLSFGKQTKSQTPLEAIHNATRRSNPNPNPNPNSKSKTTNQLPSLSSSSREWLNSLRPSKNPTPPPADDNHAPMVGPPPPPPRFRSADDEEEDDDGDMIGPPPPPPTGADSEDESDEEDVGNRFRIPLSNEIVLKGHTKVVSALAVDHSGSRVLSGSYDYTVHMYDFQGMNARLQSFRQLEPFEGHQVRNLSWSPTADRFLCVTGSAQAKIYDRDGLTLGEFVKGDMYIRDLKNTKGHISGLTCGEWHPKAKETILTSSEDGSLRIWDVNDFKSQKQVIKPKLARPGRVPVTTCAWDRDGKCIAGGIGDGSIQIWNIKPGWGSRPDIHIEKGHEDDISGMKFSSDGRILLSRSFDGSLKVWDLRKTKESLKVFEDLPNHYGQTNIAFSPDEQLFLTGTSVERESSTGGLLCFFDRANLELVSRVGISPTCSVVQCSWHPKLNQIFATVGDKSQGGTHILYDPTLSERGALVCVARAPRKKSIDDFEAKPVIHNPHALPLFRDQPSRKRQREKILKDPLKSHKPELPITGPGFGGRVGASQGSLLTQYLLKQGGMIKETWMEEDPREAILKYADAAAKDPKFIAPAYAETQPEPVFAKSDSEDEEK
ncbi:WD repeat-containing protein 70 isoform X2 [Abrus precatorius]|uniref:WD repeat-containing protein 70 isoform X2 n=1 Tax=Abrus precatorius TaxID=3816 RepID=A0A8B8L5B4_ABRPR|nr:WD repeat-containing protein 70 isoform X2 [Abrus precatorius]